MTLSTQLVLSNLLVASLIGGVAWLVGRSGRRAALAHVLWVVFFVKLVTPAIVVIPITSSVDFGSVASRAIDILIGVGLIWLLGFALVVARGLVRFLRFRQLLRREGVYDDEAESFVQSLLATPRDQCPRVIRVPVRVSPMLFGCGLRPVIVCPEQLWQVLSLSERRAFLAHETAHYCRRDHWVRWLEWMVTATYWWFPGVHFARTQLERHEEACCDAWAVRRLGSTPRQYAEGLLQVVDFISEHSIGMPRLASGMQPTDSLEERIRLLLQHRGVDETCSSTKWCAGVACFTLWLVHPITQPANHSISAASLYVAADSDEWNNISMLDVLSDAPLVPRDAIELPEHPLGFWNHKPRRQWANYSLKLPGAKLVAEAGHGIMLQFEDRDSIQFTSDELTSLVEIPSTQRVVIGDRSGSVRLWDLSAGMPVSLIGQHTGCVTSLAYHGLRGLVSADERGSVMRWDLQSGQVLATWSSSHGSVQSIRYSGDGETIAILLGRWSGHSPTHEVQIVDSESLESIQTYQVPCDTAVVIPSSESAWVSIQWSGQVRGLARQSDVDVLAKDQVSALVLSQNCQFPQWPPLTE